MDAVDDAGTVVVLQRVQPLTTGLDAVGEDVVVLTDGPTGRVARSDAPAPPRVVSRRRDGWADVVAEIARAGDVHVVTNDEFCLTDCARLRRWLGTEQVTPTGLDGYLDKVVMKQRLADAGVSVPRWVRVDQVTTSEELPTPPGDLHYPVVTKPRLGSNSRGVRVIRDSTQWHTWLEDKSGQVGWQVEEFVDGAMCFVDALVVDGRYEPVLVGRYLGSLLPEPDVHVLGAVSVPGDDPFWGRAVALGRRVAEALGTDGSFATHLEFFDCGDELVVLEVSARAPGAMVSEMARVVSGANLETSHLRVQSRQLPVVTRETRAHAAWVSVLAHPDQAYRGRPRLESQVRIRPMAAPSSTGGRYVALMALLSDPDLSRLTRDLHVCADHAWYT